MGESDLNEFVGGKKRWGRKQETEEGSEKLSHRQKVKWNGGPTEGTKGRLSGVKEDDQLPTAPPNDSLPTSSNAINPHSQRGGGKSAGTQLGAGKAACLSAGRAGRRRLGRGSGGLRQPLLVVFLRSVWNENTASNNNEWRKRQKQRRLWATRSERRRWKRRNIYCCHEQTVLTIIKRHIIYSYCI